ncbi:MAG: dipeptidase [Pirellulales bacterium]|jgi:membrane dipeptidase|nr:dipeptidase [Thermoguttaceae bacterium]MDD4787585.1 dipeptidase [Pirellulales bacterium]MDI9444124.1 dipeptidase [Planctomycetota bacterium]NLZ03353.1 membrane dipeptidase [Pirellulaceae bacterium]
MYRVRRAWRWWGLVAGLAWIAAAGHALGAECAERTAADEPLLAKARQVHAAALTLDTHVDIAGPQYATGQLDPGIEQPRLRCDLVKMVAGGVDGVFLAAYVSQQARNAEGYRRAHQAALERIAAIRRLATAMYPDRCELATTPDDVERIAAAGKRAIMIGVENGYALGTDLSNVARFADLGVRYITLCHNGHNQICDSCNPAARLGDREAEHRGLSPLGRRVVAEMNRRGIMIDLSHAAASTFGDVAAISKAPVIASHSGCSGVNPHPRNLTDEQLRMLRANGGVIQIVAVGGFLKSPAERNRAIADLARRIGVSAGDLAAASRQPEGRFRRELAEIDRRYPPASLKDFVDHIDHAVRVAGLDHVGVGSDFDGGGGVPGFQNHADALNVTAELLRRGYTAEEITNIWGGNLLRVWRRVQAAASPEGKAEEAIPPSG